MVQKLSGPVCLIVLMSLSAHALGSIASPEQSQNNSVGLIIDNAAAYVKQYEDQLTAVIADETYTQQIRTQIPSEKDMPRARRLQSETFFMFVPAARDWMAIRDIMSIDGKPVPDRPNIREQLAIIPVGLVGATLKNYNSRFNIGRSFRNFNEPTLSLLVLDDAYRAGATFEQKRSQREGDDQLVTIEFKEGPTGRTLIRDLLLKPVPSQGELLIEAATGRVRRASLSLTIGGLRVDLATNYASDEKLKIWVPSVFREHYEKGVDPANASAKMTTALSGDYEEILCEAKYTNFRRFEVQSRIK